MTGCPSHLAWAQAGNPILSGGEGCEDLDEGEFRSDRAVFLGAPSGADGSWHTKAAAEDLKGLKPADCDSGGGRGNNVLTSINWPPPLIDLQAGLHNAIMFSAVRESGGHGLC
jgi:hypothetical protein